MQLPLTHVRLALRHVRLALRRMLLLALRQRGMRLLCSSVLKQAACVPQLRYAAASLLGVPVCSACGVGSLGTLSGPG